MNPNRAMATVRRILDEGVVIHVLGRGSTTNEEWNRLQHALGAQMQVKCISRRYLLKAKE